MQQVKEKISISILFCGLMILVVIATMAYQQKNALVASIYREKETVKHLDILQTFSSNLGDMRRESVNYLLFEDKKHLDNFNTLVSNTDKLIGQIRSTESDIGDSAAVDEIIKNSKTFTSQLQAIVNLAQKQGFEVARKNIPRFIKVEQLNTTLMEILRLKHLNVSWYDQHNSAILQAAQNTNFHISIFVAAALVMIVSSLIMLMRYASIRKRLLEEAHDLHLMLEEKNNELESVISTVSHDLRSPLVNIKGFSNELKRDVSEILAMVKPDKAPQATKLYSEVSESIGFIQSSALSMSSLIETLVKVARTGKQPVSPAKVNVSAMLAEIIKNYEFTIKENNISIELEDVPPCTADASHLNQVFSNLIDNAIKYRDSTKPLVLSITGRTTSELSTYCFTDNGIGISQQDQSRIFTMFFRSTGSQKGDGLGLAIVKKLVELNKGQIRVQSQLGKGTKFCITLPT